MCNKKPYRSKKHAREGSQSMHETIRVYWCGECNSYHTTQERYGKVATNSRAWNTRAQKRRRNGRT